MRVVGSVRHLFGHTRVERTFATPRVKHLLACWLHHVFLCAARPDIAWQSVIVGRDKDSAATHEFAGKMRRLGMKAMVEGDTLHIVCNGDTWTFADWSEDGLERTGWLRFATTGDIGAFSKKLAQAGVRHRFEHSRPFDVPQEIVAKP